MSEAAQGAGRGLISITAAKLFFIVTGFAVQVGLPRLLPSTEEFGRFSLAMSIVSVLNNVLIASTIQSLSKRVSEDPGAAGARLRQGLGIQLAIGTLLALGLYGAAPGFAALHMDPRLEPLLRIAALVPFCYAVYAALVGSLNGRRQFQRQAGLDITFSVLRTTGILGAAGLGFGVVGAVSGFAAAAVAILVVGLLVVGTGRAGPALPLRAWLGFMLPIAAFQGALNGTLLLDIQVLKRTLTHLAVEQGELTRAAANLADHYVGLYRAGQTFALVPYQVILSVTFVVFPMVARATAEGDAEATRRAIRNALRFSLLVLLALAAPISGAADGVVRIAYPEAYWAGADALRVLVFGQSGLALFVIGATILNAAGRPLTSTLVGGLALTTVIVANRVLLRRVGIGDQTLMTAGLATSLGPLLALGLVGALLKLRFGAFLSALTVARAALAAGVAWYVAARVPHGSAPMALVALIAGGLAYLAVLGISGEVGRREIQEMVASVRPGAKGDGGERVADQERW